VGRFTLVFALALAFAAPAAARLQDGDLAASPSVVVFGGDTVLTGHARAQAGERIHLDADPCGSRRFELSATVEGDGSWRYAFRPAANTVLRGPDGSVTRVRVRPRLVLRRMAPGRFRVSIGALRSFAGRRLALQSYDREEGRWRRVRTVRVRGPLVTVFSSRVPARQTVRVLLPASQARPCYGLAVSNAVTS
jgi:hypothetical protein